MTSSQSYSLKPFEQDTAFRADMMYFLLCVNRFCEAMFWEKFFDKKDKRKKLREHADDYMSENKTIDPFVMSAFAHGEKAGFNSVRPHLDCYNSSFLEFMKKLPEPTKKRLHDVLIHEFALFYADTGFDDFITALEILKQKRNDLEHFLEIEKFYPNKPSKYSDEKTVMTLGIFLLPAMRGMVTGAMLSSASRLNNKNMQPIIDKTQQLFEKAGEEQKQQLRVLYAEVATREKLDKERRQALEAKKAKYQEEIWKMCEKEGYRLGTFKRIYHMIGERAMKAIEAKMIDNAPDLHDNIRKKRITSDITPNFKHDYEAAYMLATRINLVLNRAVASLLEPEWKEALNKTANKKKWGNYTSGDKKDAKERIGNKFSEVSHIRDTIAHNGMFWDALAGEEAVFTVILRDITTHLGKQKANDIYTELYGLCKKYSRAIATPTDKNRTQEGHIKTAPEVIATWSRQRRENYLRPEYYTINKRPYLQLVVSQWVTALNNSKMTVKNEKKS
jgi:hypothetical protein